MEIVEISEITASQRIIQSFLNNAIPLPVSQTPAEAASAN